MRAGSNTRSRCGDAVGDDGEGSTKMAARYCRGVRYGVVCREYEIDVPLAISVASAKIDRDELV